MQNKLGLLLLFFSLNISAQVHVNEIDQYCAKVRKDWNCPGMGIGIIYNDTVILAKGYGTLSVDDSTQVNADTYFGIASNSKSFTTAAIAQLIDKHKLSWDTKVVEILPYFKMYNDYVTQEITIRDILSHKSGLATFSGDLIWYNSDHSRKEIIERLPFLKPKYGFRSHFGYSNILYLVAGEVIGKLSGKSWDQFVKDEFFTKLKMNRTNTSIRQFSKKEKNIAQPHAKVNGKWIPIPYINWDNMAPAGGINSTVNDMLKWIKVQLNTGSINDSAELWSAKQSREMWLPQTIDNVSSFSERLHPTKHFSAYGLGWDLFDLYGYKIVNHSGGLDGMISQTVMIPELNIGIVILTNQGSSLPYVLMHQILEFMLGDPHENDYSPVYLQLVKDYDSYLAEKEKEYQKTKNKNLPPTFPLSNYVGMYSGNVYGSARIDIKQDKLFLKLKHTPTLQGTLEHWAEDVFTIIFPEHPSLPRGEVRFILDETKSVILNMVIDVPNPDFDFTELDFNKIK